MPAGDQGDACGQGGQGESADAGVHLEGPNGGVLARRGQLLHLPERVANLPRAIRAVPSPRLAILSRRAADAVQGCGPSNLAAPTRAETI